jgi:hypothetical protein
MQRSFGSVRDLVMVFSDCLRVLTPYVGKVGIAWEDGQNYDDWDAIAQTLYSSLVDNTIAYTVEGRGFSKLTPYGLMMPDYSGKSFLFSAQSGRGAPFLKLEAAEMPFDTAAFLKLDSAGRPTGEKMRRPLRDCELSALLWSAHEEREIIEVIAEENGTR